MTFEELQEHVRSQMLNAGFRVDSNETAFLARQLEYVKNQTYDVKYARLKAREFVPVSNEAGPHAQSIVYRQWDHFGAAKVMHSLADDFPLVDVSVREFSAPVISLGDAYHYDIMDLRASAAVPDAQLDTRRAMAARRGMEVALDEITSFGHARTGVPGLLRHPNIPDIAPDNGDWNNANPLGILEDLHKLEQSIVDATEEVHAPDTMLFPRDAWHVLRSKRMSVDNTTTLLKAFLEESVYIRNVDTWSRLNDAADGGGPRLMAYERSPEVLTLEIPQEIEQFPPQAVNLAFKVNMHMRVGGVQVYYPLAIAFMDGVFDA